MLAVSQLISIVVGGTISFAGGLVAGAVALSNGWLTRKHERAADVRAKRFETYETVLRWSPRQMSYLTPMAKDIGTTPPEVLAIEDEETNDMLLALYGSVDARNASSYFIESLYDFHIRRAELIEQFDGMQGEMDGLPEMFAAEALQPFVDASRERFRLLERALRSETLSKKQVALERPVKSGRGRGRFRKSRCSPFTIVLCDADRVTLEDRIGCYTAAGGGGPSQRSCCWPQMACSMSRSPGCLVCMSMWSRAGGNGTLIWPLVMVSAEHTWGIFDERDQNSLVFQAYGASTRSWRKPTPTSSACTRRYTSRRADRSKPHCDGRSSGPQRRCGALHHRSRRQVIQVQELGVGKIPAVGVPWTHELWMSWRAQLDFYERRVDILRRFDSDKSLIRFTMPDDRIEAEVAGVGFVRLAPHGLRMMVMSPRFDEEAVTSALTNMLGEFDAGRSHLTFHVQHIIPLAASYDEARTHAIDGWLKSTQVPINDVAILADGRDQETGYDFQCEYGIIDAAEAVDRLARSAGRLVDHFEQLPLQPDITGLPDVATFLDWHWSYENNVPMSLLDTAMNFRTVCLGVTDRNSAILHTRCLPNSHTLEAL